jgi:lysophospholipase L1-like esterase
MNVKYLLGAIFTIPFLPVMYFQGKRIKASVPELPPAKGPSGQYIHPNTTQEPIKLITIGESTIAGIGVETHAEGFSGTLAKELGQLFQHSVDWKVYARSGYAAKRVTREILPEIKEPQADLIVVGIGGNDAFELNFPVRWRKDVRQMIAELRSQFPDTSIVFCNMPPIKAFPAFTPLIKKTIGNLVEILGEDLRKLVREYDKVYYHHDVITVEGWLQKFGIEGDVTDFFSDGVHPARLTYQVWAKEMAGFIEKEEEQQSVLKKEK